ncbi:MAG: hypothetical protein ACKO0W_06660 [Planctomycetota bacterium]
MPSSGTTSTGVREPSAISRNANPAPSIPADDASTAIASQGRGSSSSSDIDRRNRSHASTADATANAAAHQPSVVASGPIATAWSTLAHAEAPASAHPAQSAAAATHGTTGTSGRIARQVSIAPWRILGARSPALRPMFGSSSILFP